MSYNPVAWARNTNIYEVNTRQYTADGTFAAFRQELTRLKDMGVHVIWFMPITPISKKNRKGSLGSYYACSDYTSINPEFGNLEDFKNVVKAAHELGMKVIIDWVANHTGWDHTWTSTHPDFYYKDDTGNFKPPYPEWSDTIHLDYTNEELRLEMIDCMRYWIRECDIDGFRCDMAHLVPLDFWVEARRQLDMIKPLFWLAETEEPSYHDAFDVSYAWKLLHKMEKYWRKESRISGLDEVLRHYSKSFPAPAMRAFFTSNHDENSHSGSEYERMGAAAQAFAVLCCTWNCVPLIYSGQELPLVHKRLQFFERDPIPWTGNYQLHEFYKALLTLHASHPALGAGNDEVSLIRLSTSADEEIFAFTRILNEKQVVVALNLSDRVITDGKLYGAEVNGVYRNIFTQQTESIDALVLDGWGYGVWER